MNEVAWFILATAAIVSAVVLFLIWLRSGSPTQVDEGNQWGQIGQHLAVLEKARNDPNFRPSTTSALDRVISGLIDLIHGRFGQVADELNGRRRVVITVPPDVAVEVNPQPPQAGP